MTSLVLCLCLYFARTVAELPWKPRLTVQYLPDREAIWVHITPLKTDALIYYVCVEIKPVHNSSGCSNNALYPTTIEETSMAVVYEYTVQDYQPDRQHTWSIQAFADRNFYKAIGPVMDINVTTFFKATSKSEPDVTAILGSASSATSSPLRPTKEEEQNTIVIFICIGVLAALIVSIVSVLLLLFCTRRSRSNLDRGASKKRNRISQSSEHDEILLESRPRTPPPNVQAPQFYEAAQRADPDPDEREPPAREGMTDLEYQAPGSNESDDLHSSSQSGSDCGYHTMAGDVRCQIRIAIQGSDDPIVTVQMADS